MDDTIVVRWRFHFTLDEGADPLPAELSEEEVQLKYDILPCAGVEFRLLIPEHAQIVWCRPGGLHIPLHQREVGRIVARNDMRGLGLRSFDFVHSDAQNLAL